MAFTRSSSGDSSRDEMMLGSYFAGPYELKGHDGLSTPAVKSFVIESTL